MIDRRALLGLGPAALFSCARTEGAYFGSTVLPKTRRLVHTLPGEIESLDPAKSWGSWEFYVIPALFEGLVQPHPELPQPMAALATHYEVSSDWRRFTFYLRGHPSPRGVRLPNTDDLPIEYSRGLKAPPDNVAAMWSDGRAITAHDFVASWRRFVDPLTAAPMAYQLFCVENAKEINAGKCEAKKLSIAAIDAFTFEVKLRSPVSFFLNLITQYYFAAVPSHAIAAASEHGQESSWTEPRNIVTSGAFTLKEHRRFEELTAVRNPRYYEAGLVAIEELAFYPSVGGTASIYLYKAGVAAAMPGVGLPPIFTPAVRGKKDFHSRAALTAIFSTVSVTHAPFDNVLLRYALNMATDKRGFSDFFFGSAPSKSLVPPVPGYRPPDSLPVAIDGNNLDVLAFDVDAARALLAKAGFPDGIGPNGRRLEITYDFPVAPETLPKAEIHQQQWRRHLNVNLKLVPREFNVHFRMVYEGAYTGVAECSFITSYLDPNPFLDPFVTSSVVNPSRWTDPAYDSLLAHANALTNAGDRMRKLAECEKRLLEAMPIIPVYVAGFAYLKKPYVRGLGNNLFDVRPFKYVWIDTNWRQQ